MKNDKKAVWIKTNGDIKDIRPANGKNFTLDEMYVYTGASTVEIVPLPSGMIMVIDEEGKLTGREYNAKASDVFQDEYPLDKYPINNDGTIVGDVIYCPSKMVR